MANFILNFFVTIVMKKVSKRWTWLKITRSFILTYFFRLANLFLKVFPNFNSRVFFLNQECFNLRKMRKFQDYISNLLIQSPVGNSMYNNTSSIFAEIWYIALEKTRRAGEKKEVKFTRLIILWKAKSSFSKLSCVRKPRKMK